MKNVHLKIALMLVALTHAFAGPYDNCLLVDFQINGDTSNIYNYAVFPPVSQPGVFMHDNALSNTGSTQGTMVLASLASRIVYTPATQSLDINVSDLLKTSDIGSSVQGFMTVGSTAQYFRGDKSLATMPTALSQFSNDSAFITSSALSTYALTSSVTSGLAGKFNSPSGTTSQYLRGDGLPATFPSIPASQVNSDWNASSGVAQILNKPTIPTGTVTSVVAGTGLSGGTITTTGTVSLPNTGTAGTYSAVTTDAQGRVIAGTTRSFNNSATKTLVTSTSGQGGVVLDAARDVMANYSVSTSTTATIGGASSVTVYLEVAATNSVTPSDWTTIAKESNSQTITLAIALQSVQANILNFGAVIPAGQYVRIRYAVTGTTSCAYDSGQEVKL